MQIFLKLRPYGMWKSKHCVFFLDAGKIGPDYQPGHAHADTLTLELSIHGRRLFVDPGAHSYSLDNNRVYDRCTGSHNTVEIDRVNSGSMAYI